VNDRINELKPAVQKKYLILLAGLAWFGVGVMLADKAFVWFIEINDNILLFSFIGFVFAMVFHHFGFLRIADKNLQRISEMEGLRCIFSFIKWQSYVLILVMISFGVILRQSGLPMQYVGIVYLTIGLSLILSSIRYFRFFLKKDLKEQ
jgi:hypothetical protein